MKEKKPKKAGLVAQDWHPADIVAALHKAGYTLEKLGEKYNLKSGQTFSKAMRYSFPSAEQRIAEVLGIHPKTIWPSRYNLDGSRKLQGFRAIESTRRSRRVNGNSGAENHHEAA
ncbi:MAG: helix-turn-helix domain-containing protein [Methylovulum sp.]|uniref:helix-turn-helix domain-containing protein n=1 Tax=Methylovulum sp. TaxID=1916980 RepID=UPI0026307AEC|nr:helix-turn-helix domain-containing protein [Methylovulum sp.]MDD2725203.1 helix-turn-helix domain-containing protein [Methylovulum sp.]MDD5125438.1 helix-turn-helix domain-containing protein [Methylovulum sp.]